MNISPSSAASPATAAERRIAAQAAQAGAAALARSEPSSAAVDAAAAAEAAKTKPEPEPSAQQLAAALKNINTVLQIRSPDLEFSVDRDSARTVVKVVDSKTQEVIRQMPTKEALEIAKALEHLQSLLIREQA